MSYSRAGFLTLLWASSEYLTALEIIERLVLLCEAQLGGTPPLC
jgi:hypothetical protein